MQKKIIALAIASALVAPAAFADTSNVTVYGVADVSYDMIKTGSGTTLANGVVASNGLTSNRVSSNSSRIGLKGAEDLGDGLSAIWQVETLISIGNTTGTATTTAAASNAQIGNRDTFAGLSSTAAGTVILGRHDTPYKMATRKYDMFADGIADNRTLMGGGTKAVSSFDGRQDQVIAYISPKLGDIATLAAAYVNLQPAANLSTNSKANATSLAALFDIEGGFNGSLAYEEHSIGAGTTNTTIGILAAPVVFINSAKEKASKLGLGYTSDAFAVGFAYEKTTDNAGAVVGTGGANLFGHSDYYLSGKYNFGSNAVKAAYTKANTINGVAGSDAKQYSLGFDHNLSKRTAVYALYTRLTNGAGSNYNLASGISSVGGASTLAGFGATPSAFAIGMRHTF